MAQARRTIQHDFYVFVDAVVLTVNPDRSLDPRRRLEVLVMRRPGARAGHWALPGGAVGDGESLEEAAVRKVREETGISLRARDLHQVGAFGDPDRDDRFRAVTIAFVALVPHPDPSGPLVNSVEAEFVPYRSLRDGKRTLEFDHRAIIYSARSVARRLLEDTTVALNFCQSTFTMSELRGVYEAFTQNVVDPANFRRKVESARDFVVPVGVLADTSSSRGRPPMLYRAGRAKYLNPPIRFRKAMADKE